ncbi:mucoidy inhibitor MuiA family protein [uncultured Methylobacterium sp.]|uniref:mucoidy inhibitor MuiA family protein n=1 Tax=uncultured Methylobacterium sp. TaxID=157278 RepID=UPI0035CC76D1
MRIPLACLIIAAPQALRAADLAPASRIERVTVYPDAALVTRRAVLDLPDGASTVSLRGLPASLDPASVQVAAQADGALTIGAVDVRTAPGEARPVLDPALQARIDALREEREGVTARLRTLDAKQAMIERYAKAGPDQLGVEGRPFDVAQWQGAWEAVGSGLAAVLEEARGLRRRERDLDAAITASEQARPPAPRPGAPRRDLSIALAAGGALHGEILVTYRVAGAAWRPTYEARLDTGPGKPALDLVRRAEVSQKTGEDWTDVELSVSTVRLNREGAAPDLPPLQVSFYEPPAFENRTRSLAAPVPDEARHRAEEARRAREAAEQERAASVKVAPAPPRIAVAQEATLDAGSYQASYRVPGRVDVAQLGLSKTFTLAARRVEPGLAVVAVPEIDQTAYLSASFPLEDEAPLLPGEVALHRDGAFVGRAQFRLTAPGDTVDLGFGADDRVKVVRVPVRRRENEPTVFGQSRTDLREFKTTVRNLHAEPVRITVTDRVPYSENTAITVEQLRETTAPTEKQPNDRRGVLAWTYTYRPGEQRDIRLAYRLKWPADQEVVFEPRPVAPGTPRP